MFRSHLVMAVRSIARHKLYRVINIVRLALVAGPIRAMRALADASKLAE